MVKVLDVFIYKVMNIHDMAAVSILEVTIPDFSSLYMAHGFTELNRYSQEWHHNIPQSSACVYYDIIPGNIHSGRQRRVKAKAFGGVTS